MVFGDGAIAASLTDPVVHSQCVYMNFNQISPMVTQFNCRIKMLPKCLYFTINHMLSCGNRLILQLFCVSLSFWWTGWNDLNTRMQRSVIISSHPAAQLLLLYPQCAHAYLGNQASLNTNPITETRFLSYMTFKKAARCRNPTESTDCRLALEGKAAPSLS